MQPSPKPTNPIITMPGRGENSVGRSDPRPGRLTRFLLLCAGADPETINLEECKADRTRYAAIGALIVGTFCLASLSASYALYAVFKSLLTAVPLGCFWGWNVSMIERFFVISLRKAKGGVARTLAVAVPRLMMAAATAAVISAPLELRIFEPEVDLQLATDAAQARTVYQKEAIAGFPEVERLEAERAHLAAEIAEAEHQRDAAQKSAIAEAEGIEGTLLPGFGRVYLEKHEFLETRTVELNRARKENEAQIRDIDAKLADKRTERDGAVSMLMTARNRGAGLLARLRALKEIEADRQYGGTMSGAIRLVFLLLLMVETAPVLGKLAMGRGAYDALLEARENAAISHSAVATERMREALARQAEHDAGLEEQAWEFEREAFQAMLAEAKASREFADAQKERTSSFLVRVKARLARFVSSDRG
jgi:hypothetical protein